MGCGSTIIHVTKVIERRFKSYAANTCMLQKKQEATRDRISFSITQHVFSSLAKVKRRSRGVELEHCSYYCIINVPVYSVLSCLFHFVLLFSILFCSVPLCCHLFFSILLYSIMLYSILLYSVVFYSVEFCAL